ncbi:MAG: hypothetical protein JXR23_03795 [Pontiellaceae bacterium]|nr:hypothetical protein [Pontiellaceae bacterium]
MKLSSLLITATLGLLAGCSSRQTANDYEVQPIRIGIYDSRAIVVGFVGSEIYRDTDGKMLEENVAEYNKAVENGDTARAAELEAWGLGLQEQLHLQTFSTAPVDEILAHIADRIPAIRQEANVDMLLSKWDAQQLIYPKVEKIDVTMKLVDAFKPNKKQRESAIDIQNHPPLSADEVKGHAH